MRTNMQFVIFGNCKSTQPRKGLEPLALRLKVWYSTDWATGAARFLQDTWMLWIYGLLFPYYVVRWFSAKRHRPFRTGSHLKGHMEWIIRGNAHVRAILNICQLQKYSAPEGTRTLGPQIKSLMLYRLSYRGSSISRGPTCFLLAGRHIRLWIFLSIWPPLVCSQTSKALPKRTSLERTHEVSITLGRRRAFALIRWTKWGRWIN